VSNKKSFSSILLELELDDFVVIDLETTGLNPKMDRITEISAIRFINGKPKDDFSTLVNPEIPIPAFITDITGISDSMVKNAPLLKDVIQELIDFIDNSSIVGQNIDFDYKFIKESSIKYEIDFDSFILYDTLPLARTFIYFHNSYKLSSLCEYFNISIKNAHRAKSDALATGLLFVCLIKEILSKSLYIIQKIDTIVKNSVIIKNKKLFSNIVKMAVRKNLLNGIIASSSVYKPCNNVYFLEKSFIESDMPDSPLDWFEDGGLINKKWPFYEKRSSQINLINDIFLAFYNQNIIIAEAGTGLGKSLAYLTSGFFASRKKNIPLVVSTQTKNLQEQLFINDIPLLSKVLNMNIKTVIYKGKHNYICKTRLDNLVQNHTNLLNADEYEAFMAILVWENETNTGDINECNGFQRDRYKRLWSILKSERGYCSFNKCKKHNGCYLGKIRNKIIDADIIIVNHSLFASELQNENSYLPDDFIYVVDEAHHFASIMRDQLGRQFDLNTFNSVFQYFSDKSKKSKLVFIKQHKEIFEKFTRLSISSNMIKNNLTDFFKSYLKIRKNDLNKSDYLIKKHMYRDVNDEFVDSMPTLWDILVEMESFEIDIINFTQMIINEKEKFSKSVLMETEILLSSLSDGILSLKAILDSDLSIVKWSTFMHGDDDYRILFNAFPLKVNHLICDIFLKQHKCGLFCSATLTVNDEFDFFEEQIGLDLLKFSHEIKKEIYPSPFYYSDQAKLFVYNDLKDINDPQYIPDIAAQINELSKSLKRRMLVLCTAYKQTVALRNILEPLINNDGRHLIVQKPGASRNIMINRYLKHSNSILIGTSSFWEGVDFPGDKVEVVCIVKTPFSNPFDPMIKSKIEDYEQRGDNAFLKFQIPEAIMKLRQGFGRLIRNMNDVGICIIMDTRLCKRKYGGIILNSLPVQAIPYKNISTVISDSQKFF